MSDFDNFDDLDAVRDFRAGVGLLTPEIDDRVRRRIIDLAIARGLVDGTDGRDEVPGAGSGVIDLSTDGRQPPAPAPVGSSSSDGSAAVVELPVAARPPARQPRWLVAAAAIVVVILVAGVVLVIRRGDDAPGPANQPNITVTTSTVAPDAFDQLVATIGRQKDRPLGPGEFQKTVDRIQKPRQGTGAVLGTEAYTLTQHRNAGLPLTPTIEDPSFTPTDGVIGGEFDPPVPSGPAAALFEGFTYDEVQALAEVADAQAMHEKVLAVQGDDVPPYTVLAGKLGLLRLTITPPRAKELLARSLLIGGYQQTQLATVGPDTELVLTSPTDNVTVTFSSTGALTHWVQRRNDLVVNDLDVLDSSVVTP